MRRLQVSVLGFVFAATCVFPLLAQGPGRGRGGGPRSATQFGGTNQVNQFGQTTDAATMMNARMQQAALASNTGVTNSQAMPTIEELASVMISTHDADGSGALDLTELQSALTELRNMMMQRQMQMQQGSGQNTMNTAFNSGQAGPRRRGPPPSVDADSDTETDAGVSAFGGSRRPRGGQRR